MQLAHRGCAEQLRACVRKVITHWSDLATARVALRRLRTDGSSSPHSVSGISFPTEHATPSASFVGRPVTAVALLRVVLLWRMHTALSKPEQQTGTNQLSDRGSRVVARLSGRLNVGLSHCMVLARKLQDDCAASGPLWTSAGSHPHLKEPSHLVGHLAGWNIEVLAWRAWFAWQHLAATARVTAATRSRHRLTKACLDAWVHAVSRDYSPRRSDVGSGLQCYSIASPPATRAATARAATAGDSPAMLLDSSYGNSHKGLGHMSGWRDETFLLAKETATPSAQHAPQKRTPDRMVVHQAHGLSVHRSQFLTTGGFEQAHEVMMLVQPRGHPPSPRRVAGYGG